MFPEENKSKVNKVKTNSVGWVKRSIGTIATFVISFAWLFIGFFQPGFDNTPIWIKIANGALSIFVALSINMTLSIQAITTAMELQYIKKLEKDHEDKINLANNYVEYSDEWENLENAKAYKKARTHILSQAGLKYSLYFDDDGGYIGESIVLKDNASKQEKLQWKNRVKAVEKALNLRLTHITFAAISTTDRVDYDVNNLGETPLQFSSKRNRRKMFSKLVMVGVIGQITFTVIVGQNAWQSLFNGLIQLAVFLLLGAVEYLVNWNYVTNTYVSIIKKKINLADNFIEFGKNKQRGDVVYGIKQS